MNGNLFLMALIGIILYAYNLFSWEDIMPISIDEIPYMIEFTISHMLYTFGIEIFEDGSISIMNMFSLCLSAWCM